jgi:hypothetical protein
MSSPAPYRPPIDGVEPPPPALEQAGDALWSPSPAAPMAPPARSRGTPLALSTAEVAALQGAGLLLTAAGNGTFHVIVPNAVPPPPTAPRAPAKNQPVGRRR